MHGFELSGGGRKGSKVSVDISDCTFQRNDDAGVVAEHRAIVFVKNVLCSNNKHSGFASRHSGTKMVLTKCESRGRSSELYACSGKAVLDRIECDSCEALAVA